jgi:chaperonin GroES
MKIRPTGKRLLVQPAVSASTSPGGIIIPENVKARPISGKVIALGPDVTIEVLEGDEVIYGQYSGTAVTVDDVAMLILNEDDVIGVEEPS